MNESILGAFPEFFNSCEQQGFVLGQKCAELVHAKILQHSLVIYGMIAMFVAAAIVLYVQNRAIKRLREELKKEREKNEESDDDE